MDEKASPDNRVCALITLEKIASNLAVNPSSKFSRTLPVSDETFEGTLKDIFECDIVLSELGFVKKEHMYVIEGIVDVQKSILIEKDLHHLIAEEIRTTRIYQVLEEIKEKNEIASVCRVLKLLKMALENVVRDPHATKYHRILLKKLFGAKFPGGLRLLESLGLELHAESQTVIFPYPLPRGVIHLERVLSIFDLSIKQLGLEAAPSEFD